MAAIDDLNAEIQTLSASVANLTTSVNALIASSGNSNDAAIAAATDSLKNIQAAVDNLTSAIPSQPVSQ